MVCPTTSDYLIRHSLDSLRQNIPPSPLATPQNYKLFPSSIDVIVLMFLIPLHIDEPRRSTDICQSYSLYSSSASLHGVCAHQIYYF